jgi:2-C-methyl-D-erythritol 4-phosphate cytidylyltransferase
MSTHYGIILAGGTGSRTGEKRPKQFIPVAGKEILLWSVELFVELPLVHSLVIATPVEHMEETDNLVDRYRELLEITIVQGGKTRQESSYRAVMSVTCDDDDVLIIHDAARPFVSLDSVISCAKEAESTGAAALYVPAVDTVAVSENGFITEVPHRSSLFYAQTPQCFKSSVIKKSHEDALTGEGTFSDDVSLALSSGFKVSNVPGSYSNFKVTTREDIQRAQHLYE